MHYILVFVNAKHSLCKVLDAVYILPCITFFFFPSLLSLPQITERLFLSPVFLLYRGGGKLSSEQVLNHYLLGC